MECARKALDNDTAMASAWQKILAEADLQLAKGDVRKLEYPALVYQMTGDSRYADKIREVLLKTAKVESWADKEMMARRRLGARSCRWPTVPFSSLLPTTPYTTDSPPPTAAR